MIISDAAPYCIVKASTVIQAFYSKMIHVTCLSHTLHRMSKEIRNNFPDVDALINNVILYFLKRHREFKY